MGKKLTAIIKLALQAGKATPAPPVGPALGQHGLNIMAFCNEYNAKTKGQDTVVPVEISVFEDRSFSFILKTSPTSVLLKKAVNITSGSSQPNNLKVAEITRKQLEEIAQIKLPDLNTKNLESAQRIIEGTAKNMGIVVSLLLF
jgi:large subunit ribosomal protein L11